MTSNCFRRSIQLLYSDQNSGFWSKRSSLRAPNWFSTIVSSISSPSRSSNPRLYNLSWDGALSPETIVFIISANACRVSGLVYLIFAMQIFSKDKAFLPNLSAKFRSLNRRSLLRPSIVSSCSLVPSSDRFSFCIRVSMTKTKLDCDITKFSISTFLVGSLWASFNFLSMMLYQPLIVFSSSDSKIV